MLLLQHEEAYLLETNYILDCKIYQEFHFFPSLFGKHITNLVGLTFVERFGDFSQRPLFSLYF